MDPKARDDLPSQGCRPSNFVVSWVSKKHALVARERWESAEWADEAQPY